MENLENVIFNRYFVQNGVLTQVFEWLLIQIYSSSKAVGNAKCGRVLKIEKIKWRHWKFFMNNFLSSFVSCEKWGGLMKISCCECQSKKSSRRFSVLISNRGVIFFLAAKIYGEEERRKSTKNTKINTDFCIMTMNYWLLAWPRIMRWRKITQKRWIKPSDGREEASMLVRTN